MSVPGNDRPLSPASDEDTASRREPIRSPIRSWIPLSAFALLGSVLGAVYAAHLADEVELRLRAARIDAQRLERRARRLGSDGAAATLTALGEDRDALRVRLVETLEAARLAPGIVRLRHHVEERRLPDERASGGRGPEGRGTSEAGAATLRLTLAGQVAHGAALIDLLGAVHVAGRPWPTETRGCLLQRLEATLTHDCVVDILHWSGLDAPGTR